MKTFKELRESLKDSCWKGYEAIGTKKKNGKTVPNCVPVKEDATSWYPKKGFPKEGEYGYHPNPGLKPQESDKDSDMDVAYKNDNAKTGMKPLNARILQVSNKIEKVKEEVEQIDEISKKTVASYIQKKIKEPVAFSPSKHVTQHKEAEKSAKIGKAYDKLHGLGVKVPATEEVEHIDEMDKSQPSSSRGAEGLATGTKAEPAKYKDMKKSTLAALRKAFAKKNVKEEVINERGEDSKGYKRPTEDGAGLTRKGAKAAGVKTAVTTPPSKLDPNGKAAKRRKSFCARMSGMKGPMKDEKGRPTRKAMSLRRWNCN